MKKSALHRIADALDLLAEQVPEGVQGRRKTAAEANVKALRTEYEQVTGYVLPESLQDKIAADQEVVEAFRNALTNRPSSATVPSLGGASPAKVASGAPLSPYDKFEKNILERSAP